MNHMVNHMIKVGGIGFVQELIAGVVMENVNVVIVAFLHMIMSFGALHWLHLCMLKWVVLPKI